MTTTPKPPTPATNRAPAALADQLFQSALAQTKGNAHEAAVQAIGFLADALVYAISRATVGNEVARKVLLKQVGESITNAPPHPHASSSPA